MSNLKSQHFDLNTITISKKLNFAYQYDSANLEDKVDQYKLACFEEWHPDFSDVVREALRRYASELGFDPDQWLAFHPKKIYCQGLLLKIDFELTIPGGQTIDVKGVFLDGLGELTQQIKGEALAYINGSKRKQGDLFERQDAIVGSLPEAPTDQDEQQAQESDFRFEESEDSETYRVMSSV